MNSIRVSLENNGIFKKKMNNYEYLQNLKVEYDSKWPVEIVLDRDTIVSKYNRVFKLLLQVKFAKFIM